ncbi:MAG: CDP-glucose 4,6-dehydratase [Bacteroidetes bacterium]|nr:CDP-glucose 4,6-dehydratase [Bacteroidota bacterium]
MFKSVYKNKKVIITGSTGFKGAWLSLWLNKMGAKVIGIADEKSISAPSLYDLIEQDKHEKFYQVNINQFSEIKSILEKEKPDFVFHLAAQPIVSKSYSDPLETFQTNIIGTANILEGLRGLKNKCVAIMITSDKAYDNKEWIWGYKENDSLGGKDPYSASKGAADIIIQSYYHSFYYHDNAAVRIGIGRAGNVIGGGDFAINRIVPDCYKAWYTGSSVSLRNPESVRPWQHVLEPLSGYLRMGQMMYEGKIKSGEAYNFGPGIEQNCSVLKLVTGLSKQRSAPKLKKHISILKNNSIKESGILKLNCEKAFAQLEWKPLLNFEQTLKFTSEWFNAFYSEKNVRKFTLNQLGAYEKLIAQINPELL